ncbi:MAG: hypothetical protein WBP65_23095, partial [Candidatus Sulfotelmatobacter sp.]
MHRRLPQALELRKATLESHGYCVKIASSGHTVMKTLEETSVVRRAGMPLGRKPRRQESALYLHLLVDCDIHLPVFRSADLHRRTTIATSG